MIRLSNVNKSYPTRSGPSHVLRDVNLTVEAGERVGILGRNGAGKSTLIRLVSGAEFPTSGAVERDMSVSWPLAFGGAFQGSLTGLDNLRFICRIYGVNPDKRIRFVEDFSELGIYLREPVKAYSSGMRARLAFAISMVIEFDCFLIDEIIAVGDARFHEKCNHELFVERGERAMIIVSHDAHYIRAHCTRGAVLKNGELHHFADLEEAFAFYHEQSVLAA
jgi:capsular polysaccharide transport system ATP-binding protein